MQTKVWKSALLCLATAAVAQVASAYSFLVTSHGQPTVWPAGSIPLQVMVDNTTWLSDGTTRATSLVAAAQAWNAQIGSVQFVPSVSAVSNGAALNAINEVFFTATPYNATWDESTLAVTVTWFNDDTAQSLESDVMFNPAFNWDSYRGAAVVDTYDIRRVALHELGHVLGLDHPDEHGQFVSAIMNSTVSNTDSLRSDDILGARVLYGPPASLPVFNNNPFNQTIFSGQNAGFYAAAFGNPTPIHRWQRQAAGSGTWIDLTEGGNYTGTTSTNLSVVNAATSMNGDQFRCVATNSAGSVNSSAALLTVNPAVAPTITNLPASVILSTGDTLNLTPTVTGTPTITYVWKKDNVALANGTSLSYSKANMAPMDSGQYTLTATNTGGAVTSSPVTVTVSAPLNIVRLVADPGRSRVYGLHQNGVGAGVLRVVDPATTLPIATLTVGQKPTDLAISDDGNEMLVMCAGSQNLTVVNLQTLQVTGTITLPVFTQYDVTVTAAHIKYGSGNILYYSDCAWAPVLRVLNRSTLAVLQSIMLDATAPNNNGGFGFGDFALTPDRSALFAWGQYGWNAGSGNSAVAKFTVNPDGTLTLAQTVNLSSSDFPRDPLNTPVLMTTDGSKFFIKQFEFSTANPATWLQAFGNPVYSASAHGEIAATASGIYNASTAGLVYPLTPNGQVQAITSDYSWLVYYDLTARQLRTVDLVQNVGPTVLGLTLAPADGATVLPPAALHWTPVAGANRYHVYLGNSNATVTAASTGSPEYLGDSLGLWFDLPTPLTPGATYYWRVDAVTDGGVVTGPVKHFVISSLIPSQTSVSLATVIGDPSAKVDIALTSAVPGKSWSATSSAPWITFASASGTTPSTLTVKLNATTAPAGLNFGTVSITGDDGTFTLPVRFQVDPLALTVMRPAPGTTKVYAISEVGGFYNTGSSRAYLLEIDTLFKRINRVLPVGSSVSDFTVHSGDNRIYVTNWRPKTVLAVDPVGFAVVRTYPFNPSGSYPNDPFRISAGAAGRLVVEESDQWINISLVDTVSGTTLATTFQREGGGAFDPSGRFYYHGDNNNSLSSLHKLDTAGGVFTEQTAVSVAGVSYYGDRTVVMADNGHRIFWNGVVFNENLEREWSIGAIIYGTSSDGRFAFGQDAIYDVVKKQSIGAMPVSTKVSAFNSATGQLIVQNGTALQFYSLSSADLPGLATTPANGGIVLPPSTLQWTAVPGATAYRVYLGASLSAVQNATTASAEYLGQVASPSLTLNPALTAGQTYYWRVDPGVGGEFATGGVRSFLVSTLVPSVSAIDATTVQGDTTYSVTVALSSASPGKPWSAVASVPWITFANASGVTPGTLTVKFDAAAAPVGLNAATITITSPDGSFMLPVQFRVDPLALTYLRSVSGSTKVYAISEENAAAFSGSSRAYLLEIDTLFKRISRVVRVGTGVTDLAVHSGDGRVYVTNWRLGYVLGIDLGNFALARTFAFRPFAGVGYSTQDPYRVSAGSPGRVVVEPEDQWISPMLYDTVAGTTLATIGNLREGCGAFDPAGRYYFHGDDYTSTVTLHKLDTAGDHFTDAGTAGATNGVAGGRRTMVMSADGHRIFYNGVVFGDNLTTEWTIGALICSASSDGRYAFGTNNIYDVVAKQSIGSMPVVTTVSAYNSYTGQLVVQNGGSLQFSALTNAIVPEQGTSPARGSNVLPPASLSWSPMPGASGYRVYLGTSQSAVQSATMASAEYLGQVTGTLWALNSPLAPGQTYYWRVDTIVGSEVAPGTVHSFGVSTLVANLATIDGTTIKGDGNYSVTLTLSSAAPGKAWSAVASDPWITFVQASGVTPGTLTVRLDATLAPVGVNVGSVTVTTNDGSFVLPVQFRVDPLALTVLRNAPGTNKVYAVSEENAASYTGSSRAYLLEIDTQLQKVSRVARVGTGVTDLAVHNGDGRIYVTNWRLGSLLAVDAASFAVVRTYPFATFNPGYGSHDVYRISAGGAGRLMVEAEDQWVAVSLLDTVSGATNSTTSEREGVGAFEPSGNYYFHGDNNSSGAALHKLNSWANPFTDVVTSRPGGILNYYGDRTVVMAENGHRVFWNGVVFDENLLPEWVIGAIIYSTSSDGRYAFGASSIYDVALKQTVGSMPATATVSAFNSQTGKLVLQNGGALQFYLLPNVALPPVFTTQPLGQSVSAGNPGVFTAFASGLPPPTLQWQRRPVGGAWADLGNGGNYSGVTTTTLTVTGTLGSMNGDQFRCTATNSVGSAMSYAVGLSVRGASEAAVNDFDGDGKSDIVWQNTLTGERYFWLMNGTNYGSGQSSGVVSSDWRIAATGDFNADWFIDILWENTVTGERYLWLMHYTNFVSGISLGVVPPAWRIAAAADFNGDSNIDILWENSVTGERYLWLMNGTAYSSSQLLGVVPTEWHIAAAADFNGDGKPDILWENTATGERYLWLMNGTAYGSSLSLGVYSTDWRIASTGDFNADAKADIVWENTVTGERYLWLMDGTNYISGRSLGVVSTDWKIAN